MRLSPKIAVRIALILAIVAVANGAMPWVASAADYWPGAAHCNSPHCYSRAVDWHDNLNAVSVNIQHNWMSMLDQTASPYQEPVIDRVSCPGSFSTSICPWFLSKQVWISDKGHTTWVEVGVRNGYEPPDWKMTNGQPGCNCQAYYEYWEDGPGGSSHVHVIANISPDNAFHNYLIQRGPGNHEFDIFIDGRLVGVSTTTGRNSFGESAIGSETSAVTVVQPLAYMNSSCLTNWSVRDTGGRWFAVGSPNHGVRASHDDTGAPSQTYYGGWDSGQHALCIGKGGL
jgi:hypothetical protein